jgi:hypothetical protein
MPTYTEAQYSTPSAHAMIRGWVGTDQPSPEDIERTARYMRDSLRIGGIKACRALVLGAIRATQEAPS